MKILFALITLIAFNAQASYYATHCSNSSASVHWEEGHNSNSLTMKHYDSEEHEINIELNKLDINLEKEVVLREERTTCGIVSRTKVFAAKAIITASEDHPEALDFLGEEKKLEADVICTFHMNSRGPACPDKP